MRQKIRASQLKHRIQFVSYTEEINEAGTIETTEVNEGTRWAELLTISSQRALEDFQVVLNNGYQFRVRWREDYPINQSWRIKFRGKFFVIKGVRNLNEFDFEFMILAEQSSESGS